jgi:hypothetical protein
LKPYLASFKNEAVTIVRRDLFTTFAHGSHSSIQVGDKVDVQLYSKDMIKCRVSNRNNDLDVIWLVPYNPKALPELIKDKAISRPYVCEPIIIIMEFSGIHKVDHNLTFDITSLSSSSLADDKGHQRKISKKSCPGESGCPVFDFYTNRLIGMQVGSKTHGNNVFKTSLSGSDGQITTAAFEAKAAIVSAVFLASDK